MTLFNQHYPQDSAAFKTLVTHQVATALHEDIGTGDLTVLLIPETQTTQATVIAREAAVLCGCAWFDACFQQLDPEAIIHWQVKEGDRIHPNQTLCTITGRTRALLTAERCALNFLQTLSATASVTRQYVTAIAGTPCQILDTRKTIPHLRLAQKYAVTVGGGYNQRLGLYDGILIKENHIAAAGSIAMAVQQALTIKAQATLQIEVENIAQLQQALDAGVTQILLDNFNLTLLTEAVNLNRSQGKKALLEASGNITLGNIRDIALTGVDRISIGALTKNVRAVDLSLRINGHVSKK